MMRVPAKVMAADVKVGPVKTVQGANIALACDIVIAAKSAKFIQSFANIGLIPDSGGTWTLPRLAGQARGRRADAARRRRARRRRAPSAPARAAGLRRAALPQPLQLPRRRELPGRAGRGSRCASSSTCRRRA